MIKRFQNPSLPLLLDGHLFKVAKIHEFVLVGGESSNASYAKPAPR